MNKLLNINMGIDSMAKSYLAVHAKGVTFRMDYGKKSFPDSEVYFRTSTTKSVELKRYPLKDGSYAEEFVQAIIKCKDGQKFFFLGLSAHGKIIIWPTSKIREKLLVESCSK